MFHFGEFWTPEACGQTVLPDRSDLIGQKLVENAKVQKLKCDILSNFQTMWHGWNSRISSNFGAKIQFKVEFLTRTKYIGHKYILLYDAAWPLNTVTL